MSIEAMKLALDALECVKTESFHPAKVFVHNPAITALRQAIAEAENQEPVACITTSGNLMWVNQPSVIYSRAIPLYTHPPARKPLTDEEIDALRQGAQNLNFVTLREFKVVARAIERAHGIGEV
jgi:hypothetical protein